MRFMPLLVAFSGLSPAWASGSPGLTLEPPPGWEDVTAAKKEADVLIALKGPETSSFILARIEPVALEDRGVVRTLLLDILGGLNQRTGLGFTPASNLSDATFDNGLTAHYIRANYKGKPRLILAVMELGGTTMVGTLISSVPDMLLPSILGTLSAGGHAARPRAGRGGALSLDGQLAFALGPGFEARALGDRERKLGFVIAVKGLGSEMMIMKLVDEGTPIKDQPQIVKNTALSLEGADESSLSELVLYETPAGPDLVYAWARLNEPAGPSQFAAGYMPWGYWGYSILAKGPRAADLIAETFKTLSPGPSAMPKLISETPAIPLPRSMRLRKTSPLTAGLSAAAAIVVGYLLWKRRRSATTS